MSAELTEDWREQEWPTHSGFSVRRTVNIAREVSGFQTRLGADHNLYLTTGNHPSNWCHKRHFRTRRTGFPKFSQWRGWPPEKRNQYQVRGPHRQFHR